MVYHQPPKVIWFFFFFTTILFFIRSNMFVLSGVTRGDHIIILLSSGTVLYFQLWYSYDFKPFKMNFTGGWHYNLYKKVECFKQSSPMVMCNKNGMPLNIGKCAVILFSLTETSCFFDDMFNNIQIYQAKMLPRIWTFFKSETLFQSICWLHNRNKSFMKLELLKRIFII